MLAVTGSKTMTKNPSKGSLNTKEHIPSEISAFTNIVRDLQSLNEDDRVNLPSTIGHSFSRMAEHNDH